jgi:hypothetical protein
MKKIALIPFLFISIVATAQKKMSPRSPIIKKGFYLSFNPHSIIEPEQGGIGPGIGYRISNRLEIWTEFNYLYTGFFNDGDNFDKLKGFRNITNFKYYYNNRLGLFMGIEFRIKNFSYNDRNTFVNQQIRDTLTDFQYRATSTVVGGAFFWGKRLKLTAHGKFEMEGTVGIGIKQRRISRKNIPAGYAKMETVDRVIKFRDIEREDANPYIPATIRLVYHF